MLLALAEDPLLNVLFDYLNESIDRTAKIIEEGVKERAPVDTTELERSLEVQSFVEGDSVVFLIQTDDPETGTYGLFQDVGTRYFDGNAGWLSDSPFTKWLQEGFDQ